ncbi:MAG TPA: tetratricopeptide repeat protein [Bryobacteraceae bacterium]|nr:tetratricopeptide repeat protein [Bryobacteraceae bacterium]
MLRWTVERALHGAEGPVKEHEIGLAVFGKPASWDPRIDPIVRVEFSRMRQKLRDYYQGHGATDPVIIEFPFRQYLPVLTWAAAKAEQPSAQAGFPTVEIPSRRSRWGLAMALVLVVLGAGVFVAWRRSSTPPPITTIAVLPFLDLTSGGQYEYLSNGFTEELTNSLAMVKGLRVIARTSAFQFKGKNTDVRQIGRLLGAGAVVEGSILSQGDRFRVMVRLNRTADGTHVWQAQYDREARDVLGVEDEITQAVAGALRVRLVSPPAAEFDPGQQALDEYMKGIDQERKSDPASLRSAEAHYQDAIRLAPLYALAHARLGSVHLGLSAQTGPAQQAELDDARRELEAAVSLDPRLPVASAGLVLVNYLLNWDWPSAEAGFRRALALSPSSAAHQTYAWALMTRGRFAESERHYREAIELDPLNCLLRYNLATLFSRERRAAAARQELASCLDRDPGWFFGQLALGYFELFDNRPEAALSDLHRAASLAPGSPVIEPGLAIAYAESGRRLEAQALMRQMESQSDAKRYVRYQLGLVSAYLGNRDRLFYWLGRSVDSHEQHALNMRIDPVLAPYQQDPRMIALERRTGLIQ